MGGFVYELTCTRCSSSFLIGSQATTATCPSCAARGVETLLRGKRCARCGTAKLVSYDADWLCLQCSRVQGLHRGESVRLSQWAEKAAWRAEQVLLGARVIDGAGWSPPLKQHVELIVADSLLLRSPACRANDVEVPLSEIKSVEVECGTDRRGPRFLGGGFGVQGAVEGILIASVLTSLLTRTVQWTSARVEGTGGYVVLIWGGGDAVIRERLRPSPTPL